MGISLGDIASFATGVVDADEKATQERLVDRREELRAELLLSIFKFNGVKEYITKFKIVVESFWRTTWFIVSDWYKGCEKTTL